MVAAPRKEEKVEMVTSQPAVAIASKYRQQMNCPWDRNLLEFMLRMIMIGLILVFSMIQVILIEDVNQRQVYYGIITSILGYLIPAPSLKK
jgi:hypothetical protein